MGFLDIRKLSIVRCSDDFYIFAALICLVLLPTAFLESWTEVFDAPGPPPAQFSVVNSATGPN